MTLLELVAEIGSEAIGIPWVYMDGQLTLKELENILGKKKAGLIHQFFTEYRTECVIRTDFSG